MDHNNRYNLIHLVNGVVLGKRKENITEVDQFFQVGKVNNISRREVIEGFIDYVDEFGKDKRLGQQALKNILGLFYNKRGSKLWRQLLTPPWKGNISARDVLEKALYILPEEALNERPI